MSDWWRYGMKCTMCDEETTYCSLQKKEYSWNDLCQVRANKAEAEFIYCTECKKMTRQIQIWFDAHPEDLAEVEPED